MFLYDSTLPYPTLFSDILAYDLLSYTACIPLDFCCVVIPLYLSFPLSTICYLDYEQSNSNCVLHYCVAMSMSIADLNVSASNPILFYVTLIKLHVNCCNVQMSL